ncbi:hypothetical protein A3K74_03230 [Candidatus Pacearchaeota archaeon RBG_13_33_26]|nr:MAG: hypothetical protein A3K74_03230 [Candidatus Pacearchaeota archaeon RBG_13_33_26]
MEKKVLLIQPNYRRIYAYVKNKDITPIHPPMGLAYIAAVLEKNNIHVRILEANVYNLNHKQIKKAIEDYNPSIVGITSTTPLIEEAHEIAELCNDGITVVIGGIHASSMPEETLKQFSRFDILVRGEGEFSFLEIVQGKPLSKIKGVYYRKNRKIIINPPRELIENLDSIPFPARHLLPMEKYFSAGAKEKPIDYILSSRGCPYGCLFCADHLVHGRKFRYRSPENIIAEIEELVKRGVKDFNFLDDNFTFLPDRAEKVCDLMINGGLNKKIIWRCTNGLRVDKIDLKLLKKMREAGCYLVALGIESGNEEILKKMRKNIDLNKVRIAVELCNRVGIETKGLFMLGNLGEDEKTMQDTINFAKSLNLDTATFNITTPYPNTDYWKIIKQEGEIFPKRFRDYVAYGKVIFKHERINENLLLKMQKKAYKQFYMRPIMFLKAIRKLKSLKHLKIYFSAMLSFMGISKKN